MFEIKLRTEGAAFDGTAPQEVARILRKIADRLDSDEWDGYDKYQTVLDLYGNDCGRWKLAPEER